MENLDLKRMLIGIFVGVVLVGGLWYYFYYQDTADQINRLQRDIARLLKYKEQMPVLLRKYKRVQSEFKVYSKQLPLKEEIPPLLIKLSGIIKSEGVSLLSFKPKKAIRDKSGIYYIKPISIKIRATYLECGKVFEDVSKMERLFRVKDFTISNPKIINSHKVLVDVDFSAETYYLNRKK
ncbi:type 4a pilus biogenesis protein PilO [Hippea alviniae]|uniref:type 4a pilus biogenesis protein PilO n=1 Tax=Hippea alviniae TaxID=1279027 RepID=UPI0003B4BDA0|nr:type 4a pilus biogenesis protein PilO [Hippea alviniae]